MSRPASRMKRDAFVALVGALAIALAAFGLAVVESRPHVDAPLRPDGVAVEASGSHTTTPGTGTLLPGGACIPDPPATQCTPPQERIQWRLQGLPPAPDTAVYAAFLRSGSGHEPLGALDVRDGGHVLDHTSQGLGGATHVVLVLGPDAGSRDGLVLHEAALGALDRDFHAAADGAGNVRLDQIGAVSVSLLAAGELDAPLVPGLVYRAWLQEGGRTEYLDDLDLQGGRIVLDVRIERLHVPQEGRVLVTLEAPERGSGPAGFPAFSADLQE